jgi:hypothetical protein
MINVCNSSTFLHYMYYTNTKKISKLAGVIKVLKQDVSSVYILTVALINV